MLTGASAELGAGAGRFPGVASGFVGGGAGFVGGVPSVGKALVGGRLVCARAAFGVTATEAMAPAAASARTEGIIDFIISTPPHDILAALGSTITSPLQHGYDNQHLPAMVPKYRAAADRKRLSLRATTR